MFIRLLLTLTLTILSNSVLAVDYYVATYGDNRNSGMSIHVPWEDIQHAINKTGPGDTIYIRAGTYRGEYLINTDQGGREGQYKTLRPYASEAVYIKGSKVVDSWMPEGSDGVFKVEGWPVNSQQVFVDGKPLQQIGWPDDAFIDQTRGATSGPINKYFPVGTGKADLLHDSFEHGAFFYDEPSRTLYVRLKDGANPNQKFIEVSYWTRPMHSRGEYVALKGLIFQHSNSLDLSEYLSGVLIDGDFTMVDNCVISRMDFGGIAIAPGADHVTISNSLITQNGNNGISANHVFDFSIVGNTITANNYRDFNGGWHAGGIKATGVSRGGIIDNEISYNHGDGVWWDVGGGGDWGDNTVTIAFNKLKYNNFNQKPNGVPNGNAAIHYEISKNARIMYNIIIGGRRGIYLSASSDSVVSNNTILNVYNAGGLAGIELGGVPRQGYEASRNQISENIIKNTNGKWGDSYRELKTVVHSDASANSIDNNVYSRKGGRPVFAQVGEPPDIPHVNVIGLEKWKSENSGAFDLNSIVD